MLSRVENGVLKNAAWSLSVLEALISSNKAWGFRGLTMCSLGSPGLSDIGDRGKTIICLAPCQAIMI